MATPQAMEKAAVRNGYDMSRPIKIHVCKDRTLSYRNALQPIFNGVAIPVFSVENVETARRLIRAVSSLQYVEHPDIPGDDWFKVTLDWKDELELTDLPAVRDKLQGAYDRMKKVEA